MAINQKYSFKDFTMQDLSALPATELNGQGDIVGSCFAQKFEYGDEIPISGGRQIFPIGMAGVVFKRCNLDNVELPLGNTITSDAGIDSSQKVIQQQNDLEDWVLEYKIAAWVPKAPIPIKQFLEYGISTDPADIPAVKLVKYSVTDIKQNEEMAALAALQGK